jgi:hypothetical protein
VREAVQPVVDNLNDDTPFQLMKKGPKKKTWCSFHSSGYCRVAATYYFVWMNHERDEIKYKITK